MRLAVIVPLLVAAPLPALAEDSWTGPDKVLHLGLSAAIASAGYGTSSLWLDRPGRFAVGGGIAIGAGVAKELWDLSGQGDPSWKDLAADVAGTMLGLAVSFAVDALIAQATAPSPAR